MVSKHEASPADRVDSSAAAELIDAMLETLGDCPPTRLYQLIAAELCVHPVTIGRYHRHELKSVRIEQLEAMAALAQRIASGAIAPPGRRRRTGARRPKRRRVPTSLLRPVFDGLMACLQLTEPQVIYRYLSERTGLHTTTLMRYHQGTLASAPLRLADLLSVLLASCRADRLPVLTRSRDGTEVVPQHRFRACIDRLTRRGAYARKIDLFRDLGRRVQVPAERLRKLYYDHKIRLVSRRFCDEAEHLLERMTYDAERTYHPGERILHPVFGPGVVREILRHHVLLVELHDGRRVRLRESCRHERCWERTPDDREIWALLESEPAP